MCKRVGMMLLCVMCLWCRPAAAQWEVNDAANLIQNSFTAARLLSVLNAFTKDLAPLANIGLALQLANDLIALHQELYALVAEIETISGGWDQLSTTGMALCEVDALVAWKYQALQWGQRSRGIIWKAQRLIARGSGVVQAAMQLLLTLGSVTGSTSGLQSANALLGVVASQLHQMHVFSVSVQNAVMGPDLIDSVLGVALVCVAQSHYAGWGSYSR